MTNWVVDASVAIKWVLDEDHSEAACRLLQGNYTLFVPDFFFAEIGNVLWKRVQRHEMDQSSAVTDYAAISAYPWIVYPSQELVTQAIAIAMQTKQAVYDAIYLGLAIKHDCQMVTADQKLIKATASLETLKSYLLWVEDLPE